MAILSRFRDYTFPISEQEFELEDPSLGTLETGQPHNSEGTSVLYWLIFIGVMLIIAGIGVVFKQRVLG